MNLNKLFKAAPKIEVFVRTCFYSEASAHKKRPKGFSHQKCIENFIETLDEKQAKLTFFLDCKKASDTPHFVTRQNRFPVVEISEGTEAGSFLRLLDHVMHLDLNEETILYFVEDDYLHRKGWVDVLRQAFTLPNVSYVTLYDHRDKYFFSQYETLQSRLFYTKSSHWRTIPSTTNTYAMKFKTLKEHSSIHRAFSEGRKISADHDKFCRLAELGAILISPIPGWSTHMDPEFLSPCVNWEKILT